MIWLCLTMPCSLSIFSLVFRRVFSSRSLFVSLSLSCSLTLIIIHLTLLVPFSRFMNPWIQLFVYIQFYAYAFVLLRQSTCSIHQNTRKMMIKKNATSTAAMATTKQSQQRQQRYDQVYTLYFISILMDTYTQCMSTVYAATLISALICCCCCLCL